MPVAQGVDLEADLEGNNKLPCLHNSGRIHDMQPRVWRNIMLLR